jgi:hypothetical protein
MVAVLATVGLSNQGGRKSVDADALESGKRKSAQAGGSAGNQASAGVCADLEKLLGAFLEKDKKPFQAPDSCYEDGQVPKTQKPAPGQPSDLKFKFVIATVPDPLHTHFALLFDRFMEAIQQAAQDENFVYDSSWLPWQMEEQIFERIGDQDEADERKDLREDQPGIILFRRDGYKDRLVVFVVGEEATSGIHRLQFKHAVNWISNLGGSHFSILGPSFSGSLQSLKELLSDPTTMGLISPPKKWQGPLEIHSGSVTSDKAVNEFQGPLKSTAVANTANPTNVNFDAWKVQFHSFVASDDEFLNDYCRYLKGPDKGNAEAENNRKEEIEKKVAFISEDETAYGSSGQDNNTPGDSPCPNALRLYYPRDISQLRSAYQSQSIFDYDSQQEAGHPRTKLPSDLADPSNKEHDTIPSFSGSQAPLSEEATLLGIVAALKAHRSEYLLLRCSNTLDPLFLSKFFQRLYPQGRVVIVGSDLLFQRERGLTGVNGIMMLSTYPLLPLGQDWTKWANQSPPSDKAQPKAVHSHRIFGEDSIQGTYTALRFLLHDIDKPCAHDICKPFLQGDFLPAYVSRSGPEIPDYAAPAWLVESCTGDGECAKYLRPAVWLSVMGKDSFYPVGAFVKTGNNDAKECPTKSSQPNGCESKPECKAELQPNSKTLRGDINGPEFWVLPTEMKICWLAVFGLAVAHLVFCSIASFTAKPAFRAHFAIPPFSSGLGAWTHRSLIGIGSASIAMLAMTCAWGCGAFAAEPADYLHSRRWLWLFIGISLTALTAVLANHAAAARLERNMIADEDASHLGRGDELRKISAALFAPRVTLPVAVFTFLVGGFYLLFPWWYGTELKGPTGIPAYWRAVHVASGVSQIVPIFFLLAGFYLWFWYALHGLALFGPDRPRLPQRESLRLSKEVHTPQERIWLAMFSEENAAAPLETLALPLSSGTLIFAGVAAVIIPLASLTFSRETPIRSLAATHYGLVISIFLDLFISLMLAETWQLLRTWNRLRQLLVFLDRLSLRRTLQALRGFSWGSVWKMSGNVLEVRYKLLSRQIESLNHLQKSVDALLPESDDAYAAGQCAGAVTETRGALQKFASWYAENYVKPEAGNLRCLENFQKRIAELAGLLIANVLIPAWHAESRSLVLDLTSPNEDTENKSKLSERVPLSEHEHVRNAEELVCLVYLGFAQNILGRIRTLVLGTVFLFVAATLSVDFYPFDPRNTIARVMIVLFAVVGSAIIYVYADIHRDSTLSHVTNTNPGELGTDFWFKLVPLGIGPVVGLLATSFPGIADFLLSWVEPGLASLK